MAKNEVLEAVIKDGKLYCGKCGEPLGNCADYQEIEHEGERVTQFVRYCSSPKCRIKSHYELRLSVNKREVFVFPLNECKKIKKETVEFHESEL